MNRNYSLTPSQNEFPSLLRSPWCFFFLFFFLINETFHIDDDTFFIASRCSFRSDWYSGCCSVFCEAIHIAIVEKKITLSLFCLFKKWCLWIQVCWGWFKLDKHVICDKLWEWQDQEIDSLLKPWRCFTTNPRGFNKCGLGNLFWGPTNLPLGPSCLQFLIKCSAHSILEMAASLYFAESQKLPLLLQWNTTELEGFSMSESGNCEIWLNTP